AWHPPGIHHRITATQARRSRLPESECRCEPKWLSQSAGVYWVLRPAPDPAGIEYAAQGKPEHGRYRDRCRFPAPQWPFPAPGSGSEDPAPQTFVGCWASDLSAFADSPDYRTQRAENPMRP